MVFGDLLSLLEDVLTFLGEVLTILGDLSSFLGVLQVVPRNCKLSVVQARLTDLLCRPIIDKF